MSYREKQLIKTLWLILIFALSCNKQETVNKSRQSDELNTVGSQIVFALSPSQPASSNPTFILKVLNAEENNKIKIYTDSSCINLIKEEEILSRSHDLNITLSSQGSYNFFYKLQDNEFQNSDCLNTSTAYQYDSTPPLGPSSINFFQSIGNIAKPQLSLTGLSPGDIVKIYSDSTCSTPLVEHVASSTSSIIVFDKALISENIFQIHYKIEDAAGNQKLSIGNPCIDSGQTYTLDITSPLEASSVAFNVLPTPDSKVKNDNESIISIDYNLPEINTTIEIYSSPSCSGTLHATSPILASSVSVPVFNFISGVSYRFYYRILDSAGNYSPCFDTDHIYNFDAGIPSTAILVNKTKKTVLINGIAQQIDYPVLGEKTQLTLEVSNLEVGTLATLYGGTNCSGLVLISDKEVTQATQDFLVDLPSSGGDYRLSLSTTDIAGNISSCSNDITYTNKTIVDFSLGEHHACSIFSDGDTFCFGKNTSGQLGIGTLSTFESKPKRAQMARASHLSTGLNHSCFINSFNQIVCTGDNSYSQSGQTTATQNITTPTRIYNNIASPTTLLNFDQLSSGPYHTCARELGADDLFCFGKNNSGELGVAPSTTPSYVPEITPTTETILTSAGSAHTCSIVPSTTDTKQYQCFGLNSNDQLGNGPSIYSGTLPNGADAVEVIKIVAGTKHTCYIEKLTFNDPDGNIITQKIRCFGDYTDNKLGRLLTTDQSTPVYTESNMNFIDIAAVNNYTCAISEENDIYCFGRNFNGIQKVSLNQKFIKIKVSLGFMCAQTTSGELYCKGSNSFGELGNGTTTSSELFQPVDFAFNQADISFNEGPNYLINDQSSSLTFDNDLQIFPEQDFLVTIKNSGADQASSLSFTIDPSIASHLEFTGGGAAPGVGGNCLANLTADDTCVVALTFKPTVSFPSGLDMSFKVAYQDTLSSKETSISLRGYSVRTLEEIDFQYNGSSINSSVDFNTTITPLNANNSESLTKLITIKNNSLIDMELIQAGINGTDSSHYQYSGGQFPGTNGTCNANLIQNTSCTIEIDYIPQLASSTLPDNSHQANLNLLIKKDLTITSTDLPLKGFATMVTPSLAFYEGIIPLASIIQLNDINSTVEAITATTLTKIIELKNQSTVPATISSSIISGADISKYNITNSCTTGLIIQAGQSCIINVIYDPITQSIPLSHDVSIDIDYTNTNLPLDITQSTSIQIKSFSH
jgi:alpha-tubulin suppressor-like RCC1 family protein